MNHIGGTLSRALRPDRTANGRRRRGRPGAAVSAMAAHGRAWGAHAGEPTKKTVGIVDWVDADQKNKSSSNACQQRPGHLDIMMAQEDLWVYETLLKVIRNTNNVGPDQAALQKTGSTTKWPASSKSWRWTSARTPSSAGASARQPLFNLPSEAAHGRRATAGRAVPAVSRTAARPRFRVVLRLAGRYVDDKGKPLADAHQQPYNEFRMMPINLKVVIEQREIPRLLAECANSAMRIDVRRVRILVEEPPPVDLDRRRDCRPASRRPQLRRQPQLRRRTSSTRCSRPHGGPGMGRRSDGQ